MSDLYQNINDCEIIIDALPLSICMLDRQGIVQYTNRAFANDFGKSFWDGKKKGPGDLMSCVNCYKAEGGCGSAEECRECQFRQYIENCLNGFKKNEFIEMQFTLLRDGSEEKRWYEIHINSMILERTGLLLISLQDITYYKRNSLKLLHNKKVAEETNRAKSLFLANMSHEIRTPLNGLIGMLDMTLMSDLKEEQRENLEIAKNCSEILLTLINDILDITKVESNKVVLQEIPFELRGLIQKITEIHRPGIEEKNLEFICNVEDNVPKYIKGDAFRLQQILNNLISNAVKFTDYGKIILEVKVLCKSDDSYTITFTVEDTGVGIRQQDMKHLFKLFSQVDTSFTRRHGGTGLGLVISQRLVNLMGGEIKVKSQEGKGSLFYFTIQMKTADETKCEGENKKAIDNSPKSADILLVEDDKTNQVVMRKMLRQMGYEKIDVANDGYEAVAEIEKNRYDVILMDIDLPQMDGMETTRIIREKEKAQNRRIPVIAVTAFALEGDKARFLQNGIDGYVAKPVDMWLLQNELERFTRKTDKGTETGLGEVYAAWGYSRNEPESNMKLQEPDRRKIEAVIREMKEALNEAKRDKAYFIVLERKAHEIKILAKRKGYRKIESSAFRVEMAARKADLKTVQVRYEGLEKVLRE